MGLGFLIVIALLVLSSWSIISTVRRLRRTKSGRNWRIAFASLGATGLVAGIWLAFKFDYQVSPTMRFISFPMPLGFFHLENGVWIDFVTPPHVMYPGVVANVLTTVALTLLPVSIGSWLVTRRRTP
jgi:hypothetical protein